MAPQIAQDADWHDAVICAYGQDTLVQIAVLDALWHGSFKTAPGRVALARDPGSGKAYDLRLFTFDTSADAANEDRLPEWIAGARAAGLPHLTRSPAASSPVSRPLPQPSRSRTTTAARKASTT